MIGQIQETHAACTTNSFCETHASYHSVCVAVCALPAVIIHIPLPWSQHVVSTSSLSGTPGSSGSGSGDVWHHVVSVVGKNGGNQW